MNQEGELCRLVLGASSLFIRERGGRRSRFSPFGRSGPPFPSPLYMSDRSKPSVGLGSHPVGD